MRHSSAKRFGNYTISAELGKGGMAIVYKAYQPALNRYVALKVLPPQLVLDETFVQRFLQEAKTAAGLDHPNIISIYDVGETDGMYYIAMQYVAGGTLQQLIKREGALSPARAVFIAEQLASALDYAHSRGLIHRDVKPSNVLMGEQDHAVLTDFGIARAAEGTRLTRTGILIGTPEYMSPEQARGDEIDHRSDLYSLGVVVYEMLSGRVPFTATGPHAVLHKVVYETPPPLRAVARGIPPAAEKVVSRALAKRLERRHTSAGQMAQDLARALGMVPKRTPTPAPRTVPAPTAENRAGESTVSLESTSQATGGEAAATSLEGIESLEAEPAKARGSTVLAVAALALLAGILVLWSMRGALSGGGRAPEATSASHIAAATRTSSLVKPPIVAPSSTPVPSRTPTRVPAATATPVPASPTATRSATPTATRTASPTATVVLQPVLETPADGVTVSSETVLFSWVWPRALEPEEYFDVRVWREGAPHYGIAWTKEQRYETSDLGGGEYYWSIAVVRHVGTAPDGGKQWVPVGQESDVRSFTHSISSQPSEPTKPPPPTEPTKPPPSP